MKKHLIRPGYMVFLFILGLSLAACDRDKEEPGYIIPETYSFENVSYSGQTQRLAMLSEMKDYMKSIRIADVPLEGDKLKAMYRNDKNMAGWQDEYEESKQLKNKTVDTEQSVFEDLIDELALASQSTSAGVEGQSGLVWSKDGSVRYLLGDDGLDHAQLIEKGLMGACFYFQATAIYLGTGKMLVDNETVEPGQGTPMEHHWDEAFGYFGVPKDFPANLNNLLFWGNYSNKRNGLLGSNQLLMDALIKGRAAISYKDMDTRDEAIMEVREHWEQIAVGSALHYLNESINYFDDIAIRGHALSEGIGFIYGLQFNPERRIDLEQVDQLLNLVAGSARFHTMNIYQITADDLVSARDLLAAWYNLEDVKEEF